jgi:hypothetical protein
VLISLYADRTVMRARFKGSHRQYRGLEHRLIPTFDAQKNSGQLTVETIDPPRLFELVMSKGAALVRGCVAPDVLSGIRAAVHAWGLENDLMPAQTYIDENFHAIESGISPGQKTPHCYHAYNFNKLRLVDSDIRPGLLNLFERLSLFQNQLTGKHDAFEPDRKGRMQRPQIIHYPSGGGVLGRHMHPLEPQRVGLVLGLSKRGEDFTSGGTWFEVDGRRFGTEDCHDLGDLIVFRYDIPHWVTAIDQGEKFDPSLERGRWTAVLPFY